MELKQIFPRKVERKLTIAAVNAREIERAWKTTLKLNSESHRASVRLLFGFSAPCFHSPFIEVISGVRGSPRLLCVRASYCVLSFLSWCCRSTGRTRLYIFYARYHGHANRRAPIKEEEEEKRTNAISGQTVKSLSTGCVAWMLHSTQKVKIREFRSWITADLNFVETCDRLELIGIILGIFRNTDTYVRYTLWIISTMLRVEIGN